MPSLRRRQGGTAAEDVKLQIQENVQKIHAQYPFLPFMAGGFFLGGLVVYLSLTSLSGNRQTVASAAVTPRSLRLDQQDDGWHQIHVFYGDKKGLGEDLKKASYAQCNQDRVILDLIGESGFFIDLAANDALELTNTLVLERYPGWNGLCIEPNPGYWYGLSHRKCTVVGALMADKVEQVEVKFRGVYGGIVGKMNDKLANFKKEPDTNQEKRYTANLQSVLERFQVPKTIDYLSLDIEGAEFMVMQHFPFDKYNIKVMTVERPKKNLKQRFEEKGFIHLKDLTWWGETLWAHKSTGLTPDHPKVQKIKTEEKN